MFLFPPLRSLANPTGPVWATARPNARSRDHLWRSLVTFIGLDPRRHIGAILGSGFIVGSSGQIMALTAGHIFVDWLERIQPSKPHALRGLVGDAENFSQRFLRAARDLHAFHAVLDFGPGIGPRVATIAAISLSYDYLRNDTAVVTLEVPEDLRRPTSLASILMDTTPFADDQSVFMAGIVGGEIEMTPDRQLVRLGRHLVVHVGFIVEEVANAEGYRGIPMYRANMPSLGGMSGGPAFVLRNTDDGMEMPTAVGIVSRSRLAPGGHIELLDHCRDGETWVSPIGHAYGSQIQTAEHGLLPLHEIIGRGMVEDYDAHLRARHPAP